MEKVNQNNNNNNIRKCNCRNKTKCPLRGECLTECVVYKATITTPTSSCNYFGSTEGQFKTRYNNHMHSFRTKSKKHSTTLATLMHNKKEQNITPNVIWSIEKNCKPYICGSRRCDLCLTEKLAIIQKPNINKRSEIINKCRHRSKYKLKNVV